MDTLLFFSTKFEFSTRFEYSIVDFSTLYNFDGFIGLNSPGSLFYQISSYSAYKNQYCDNFKASFSQKSKILNFQCLKI